MHPSPETFSLWSLFLQADWIVKGVIIMLILASIGAWSITFSKWFQLLKLNREANSTLEYFTESALDQREGRISDQRPFAQLKAITVQEWKRIRDCPIDQKGFALQRLEQLLMIRVDQQRSALLTHLNILASIGSMSPFVGLFGTVWGIMNSFQCIATAKSASLAIVAPGLAEALFATAIGLMVAIPAVISYSRIVTSIQGYSGRMENFAQELLAMCMK